MRKGDNKRRNGRGKRSSRREEHMFTIDNACSLTRRLVSVRRLVIVVDILQLVSVGRVVNISVQIAN